MYNGNPGEADFGSSQRGFGLSGESTACCENLTLNFLYTVNRTFFDRQERTLGARLHINHERQDLMDLRVKLYQHCKFQVLSRKGYIIDAFLEVAFQKIGQTVPSFLADKPTTSPGQGTSEIFTVKERSHIANTHLKIMRIGPKSFLGRHKKTTACL